MKLLKMFDKLDDIIYEPVKVVADYLHEPIKAIDAHMEVKKEKQIAAIENEKKQLEADIEIQKGEANIELQVKQRKLNAEIDDMIAESELKRNTAIVEAIKQYQLDLGQAVNECVYQIGNMSLELRERANNLVIEKTKEYTALQEKSKADAKKELKEIEEMFADNERVKIKMEDAVIDQMRDMVTTAGSFIRELAEDMRRLNENIDELTKKGQDLISKYLSPMTAKIATENYTGIEQK